MHFDPLVWDCQFVYKYGCRSDCCIKTWFPDGKYIDTWQIYTTFLDGSSFRILLSIVCTLPMVFYHEITSQSPIEYERVFSHHKIKNTSPKVRNITSILPKYVLPRMLFVKIVHYDYLTFNTSLCHHDQTPHYLCDRPRKIRVYGRHFDWNQINGHWNCQNSR